jgi:hypothetical protein
MQTPFSSLPRTLNFGATNLLAAGAGRMAGSYNYLNTNTGKVVELRLARIVHAGTSATAIFDNPALSPVLIPGDATRNGLAVGALVLIETRHHNTSTEVAHWFLVQAARPTPKPAPKPAIKLMPASVVGIITEIEPSFKYAWAVTAKGERFFVSASERRDGKPFLIHQKVKFNPTRNAKGPYALNVVAA